MKQLTEIQRKVYDFIVSHRSEQGLAPTRAEICGHFGWASPNAAEQHLRAIEKKGWISLLGHKRARGIVVTPTREKNSNDYTPFDAKPNTLEG